jgi:signal peptidase
MFERRLISIGITLVVLTMVATWFFTLRPTFLGGSAVYITVTGTSMEPTLHGGDFVILQERESYRTGDIIAYPIPEGEAGAGSRIIHRIIGGSGSEGYVTQGDNRVGADSWRPTDAEVLGSLWFHAPAVGRLFPHLRAPLVIAALAGGLALWLVLGSGKAKPRRG